MGQQQSRISREDRQSLAVLGAGIFTNGVWDMLSVVVPLHAVAVGLSAAEIGLIVASRSVLPSALSIHGGILMDQLGTQRVLIWVAACSVLLPLLYPLVGWFGVLTLLQLLLGLASSVAMAASQTWSVQTSRGDTALLARYSVATRIGTFVGPVMVGAAWDLFGAWVAFACISLCGAGTIVAAAEAAAGGAARVSAQQAPSIRVLLPRWSPHKQALMLAVIPAVAFILIASFLRGASGAIQNSLYIVYLNDIGLSATFIGALVALAELAGVLGSLAAAPMQRRVDSRSLVLACIAVSLTAIAITPLIGAFVTLLIAACIARGIAQGMSQPLVYSVLSVEVPDNRHGASVGLRNAVVRLASILTPAAMGIIADAWGIEASFYAIGTTFLLATAALAFAARRMR